MIGGMVFIQFRKSLASALGHWPVMISWPVASASQHEDPIVYKRDSTKEYIMAYFKRVGGNTKSAIGLAKTKGVDTATEIELSTLNNIIYQFCIVDKQTSLKQAKSELLDMWKHVKESNPNLKTEGISLDREPRTKNS